MAEGDEGEGTDWFSKLLGLLQNRITLIGGVVSAVLAVNAGLTSCTDENLQRTKAFEDRVTAEEAYWNGMYDKYLSAVDATADPTEEAARSQVEALRKEKLNILYAIATTKKNTDFRDYALGIFRLDSVRRDNEYQRLNAMQDNLIRLIKSHSGSDIKEALASEATADSVRERDANGNVQAAVVKEPADAPKPVVPDIVPLSYDAQILAAGASNGYDIDVFWCEGADQQTLFALAGGVARNLANISNNRQAIGNKKLGRIRLRPLLKSLQTETSGYPSDGLDIRYDTTPSKDELNLAVALQAEIQKSNSTHFDLRTSHSGTRYYLSLFVCSVPTQASPLNSNESLS